MRDMAAKHPTVDIVHANATQSAKSTTTVAPTIVHDATATENQYLELHVLQSHPVQVCTETAVLHPMACTWAVAQRA